MSPRARARSAVLALLAVGIVAMLAACSLVAQVNSGGYGLPAGDVSATAVALGSGAPSIVPPPSPSATPTPTSTRTPSPTSTRTPSPTPTPVRPPASRPPTRIVAPAIGLDARVVVMDYKTAWVSGVPTTGWLLPDYDAGFHASSAYPGNSGNTVISAHHNYAGEVFRYLVDLEAGDVVTVYVGSTAYRYAVSIKTIVPEKYMPTDVRAANAAYIGPTPYECLTLVTCWPYTGSSHRVIVVALPVP